MKIMHTMASKSAVTIRKGLLYSPELKKRADSQRKQFKIEV
jgi:hypothetical protein